MTNGWTPERRARQAELIRQWQPWRHSSGPTSAEGKSASSRNAWKGGIRPYLRNLSRMLSEQEQWRRTLLSKADPPDDTAD